MKNWGNWKTNPCRFCGELTRRWSKGRGRRIYFCSMGCAKRFHAIVKFGLPHALYSYAKGCFEPRYSFELPYDKLIPRSILYDYEVKID